MRVTDNMIFKAAASSSGAARDRLQQAVDENTTGLKVEHPWDDPSATAPLVSHRLSATRFDAMATVAQRAGDELNAADNALGGITDLLSRARELATQMSNGTYDASDRTGASVEAQQLFTEAVGYLNTQVGDRYIFAGFSDNQPAFSADGTYQGDSGVRQVEAFPGVMQDVSLRGDVVATGAGGTVSVLDSLKTLATSLQNNDQAGVQGTLDTLDASIQQISLSRAQVGATLNTLDAGVNSAKSGVTTEKTNISNLSEADVFESATNMALAQRALESALTASAQSFNLSLLDKLK